MGLNTKIQWATHTWNPWYGCPDDGRRSPACDNCYARLWAKRSGIVDFDREIKRASDKVFYAPLNRNKYRSGDRVFVCSLSDFFHEAVIEWWRHEAMAVISGRPDLTFMLLTKRPESMGDFWKSEAHASQTRAFQSDLSDRFVDPLGRRKDDYRATAQCFDTFEDLCNVWLGVTVENQEQANIRIPQLLETPAPIHFVSAEPTLGALDLWRWLKPTAINYPASWTKKQRMAALRGSDGFDKFLSTLDWVIAGGESGPGARPMHPDWVRALRDQCAETNIPFFFKQWGTRPDESAFDEVDGINARMDLKNCGNLLDGRFHEEFPEVDHA